MDEADNAATLLSRVICFCLNQLSLTMNFSSPVIARWAFLIVSNLKTFSTSENKKNLHPFYVIAYQKNCWCTLHKISITFEWLFQTLTSTGSLRTRCWIVNLSSKRICGLEGTSVVLPCIFEYPDKDEYQRGEWHREGRGRVSEQSNSNYPDCSLNIDKLSSDHAGVYKFQFQTILKDWITDSIGVTLSVTGKWMQV